MYVISFNPHNKAIRVLLFKIFYSETEAQRCEVIYLMSPSCNDGTLGSDSRVPDETLVVSGGRREWETG